MNCIEKGGGGHGLQAVSSSPPPLGMMHWIRVSSQINGGEWWQSVGLH